MNFSGGPGTDGWDAPWWVIFICVFLGLLVSVGIIGFLVKCWKDKDDDFP
jgi:hypothetical protein